MRKEQVRKDPRDASITTKQDNNTPKSLELSEGQLEVHFRRRLQGELKRALSLHCCPPKSERTVNRSEGVPRVSNGMALCYSLPLRAVA